MHYIGEFNDNGQFHGKGILKHPDGSVYDGEWKDGKRHGFGTYSLQKTNYTGYWKDDFLEGTGELSRYFQDTKTTETFEGVWKGKEFIGTITYTADVEYNGDRNIFTGIYQQETFWQPEVITKHDYGRGIFDHTDNQGYTIYSGEITNGGQYHGLGIEVWDDSPMYYKVSRGKWYRGQLVVDAEKVMEHFMVLPDDEPQKQITAIVLDQFCIPEAYREEIGTLYRQTIPDLQHVLPTIDVLYSPSHCLNRYFYFHSSVNERQLINDFLLRK
jgi:hypothetical protein